MIFYELFFHKENPSEYNVLMTTRSGEKEMTRLCAANSRYQYLLVLLLKLCVFFQSPVLTLNFNIIFPCVEICHIIYFYINNLVINPAIIVCASNCFFVFYIPETTCTYNRLNNLLGRSKCKVLNFL